MKKEITVKKIGNRLIINERLYEPIWKDEKKDSEILNFRLVKDKGKLLDKINKLAKRLSSVLDSEEVLKNALGEIETESIDKLYKSLILKGKKPKVRHRHGCLEMVVGKETLQIR